MMYRIWLRHSGDLFGVNLVSSFYNRVYFVRSTAQPRTNRTTDSCKQLKGEHDRFQLVSKGRKETRPVAATWYFSVSSNSVFSF